MNYKNSFLYNENRQKFSLAAEGSIEYYKNMMPCLFDNDDDYAIFTQYYIDHPEIHTKNELREDLKEIDLIKNRFQRVNDQIKIELIDEENETKA